MGVGVFVGVFWLGEKWFSESEDIWKDSVTLRMIPVASRGHPVVGGLVVFGLDNGAAGREVM